MVANLLPILLQPHAPELVDAEMSEGEARIGNLSFVAGVEGLGNFGAVFLLLSLLLLLPESLDLRSSVVIFATFLGVLGSLIQLTSLQKGYRYDNLGTMPP